MDKVWTVTGISARDSALIAICEDEEDAKKISKEEMEAGNGWSFISISLVSIVRRKSYCIKCSDGPLCTYEYFHCASCLEKAHND